MPQPAMCDGAAAAAAAAADWPPGTVKLEEGDLKKLILHPTPTSDPNDPLNWSAPRKALNFTLVCLYTLLTFVQLDVGFTAWDQYSAELGFSDDTLNGSAAANYLGLALGCVALVPLVHKLGRRPVYLLSTLLQLASCIWSARTSTVGDLYGSNVISGVGGAISETIVQITIADLFFVHQHATVNGLALLATFAGAYLGPVASGYVVEGQGWRWVWWWCSLLFGVNLLLVLFLFEETKYVCPGSGVVSAAGTTENLVEEGGDARAAALGTPPQPAGIDASIPMRPLRRRFAFLTVTGGSMLHDVYEPLVILLTFPAITYTAIAYGVLLAWFAALVSVQATYMFDEPYNFSAIGIGLMNIAPFVASIPGVWIGGYLNDKSIVWLARRNGGVYEPEMRLWMIFPLAIIAPAGILMFGLGLNSGAPWPLLAVGFGMYGFCLTAGGVVSLAYAMDCYHDVIGNALVGVTLIRNLLTVVILFVLTPWLDGMGIQDVHILIAVLTVLVLVGPVGLIIWGKKARKKTAAAYRSMAQRQPTRRDKEWQQSSQ
ncbi:Major facilitator superfamily transporter [Cordyceps fumosorosea ARSEF 2679]|uniref:Major facilitator superfamily transporter n=1 Tax=Cordyceps fumosorosea (strain ARSEF 2679) TaxID=1081104 RepID=A0A167I8K8_CORFA|nr:Major facilitator superfamily transporter [Cordyceps fumosorosea ARSEF 2679]OAA48789.1 Major facilitator superfamily transporter [Cordyceps fumosorosea ARSEF 2679]